MPEGMKAEDGTQTRDDCEVSSHLLSSSDLQGPDALQATNDGVSTGVTARESANPLS